MIDRKEQIKALLKKVHNPKTNNDLVADQLVVDVQVDENDKVVIFLGFKGTREEQTQIEDTISTMLSKIQIPKDNIQIRFTEAGEHKKDAQRLPEPEKLKGVKNIIAVGSGKGGVGKSTVSVNLAYALSAAGYKTGLLDADVHGPSVGKMVGQSGKAPLQVIDNKIIPLEKNGVKIMSFAFLIEEGVPIVWRGSLLHKAVHQLLFDMIWDDLDFLIVDLPPGTGDVQLSLAQAVKVDGAIVVTTPQNVAFQDASRAALMFDQVKIPMLGVIENMSEFICPHCGNVTEIFSQGGGKQLAEWTKTSLLGKIPLHPDIMNASESGEPVTLSKDDKYESIRKAYGDVVKIIAEKLEIS